MGSIAAKVDVGVHGTREDLSKHFRAQRKSVGRSVGRADTSFAAVIRRENSLIYCSVRR